MVFSIPNCECNTHTLQNMGKKRIKLDGLEVCNPNTWKAEAGGARVQIQPQLHREVKAS